MILPCIDVMGGKIVQLVRGRDKALELDNADEALARFAAFPELQLIDLDAAIGSGENRALVESIAARAICRVGGGIRSAERARRAVDRGARRVIVGTAAFNRNTLESIVASVGRQRVIIALDSQAGQVMVKGWREGAGFTAEQAIGELEPYCSGFLCTYVDKEGMLQGTDLAWFRRLRAATALELTAAGGITAIEEVRALLEMNVHAALGMAIYAGRLDLTELAKLPGALAALPGS